MHRPSERWSEATAAYLTAQHANGRPRTTRETRRQHLEHLARRVDAGPWELSSDALAGYLAMHDWARETRRGRLVTLTSFYTWAMATGRATASPVDALERVRPGDPNPRPVPDAVYLAALARADDDERLWIDLAAEHGLRRAEVAAIHSDDLVQTLLGWDLDVRGKGGKRRRVPLTSAMARALRERGRGWLFPGDDGGHVSPRWLGTRVSRLLGGGWTMHKLRHRAATRFWTASSGDPYVVADLMGWANLSLVRVYVALPDERRRAVVEGASRGGVPVSRL